jgi:hypothetical protein
MVNGATPTPDALKLIRVALVSGVFVFGMVAFFVSGRMTEPPPGELLNTLQLSFGIVAVTSLVGAVVLRSLQARASEWNRRVALVIASWALGEAPALVGGMVYLLTADPLTYVVGVAILFFVFGIVHIPEQT